MPALTLNDWTIPLATDTERQREVLEDAERSVTGDLLRTRIGIKHTLSCETTPLPAAQARDLEGLLLGEADHWAFDENGADWGWSEAGIAVYSGTGTPTTSPSPKYGQRCLSIAAGAQVAWSAAVSGEWTLLVWKWDGSAWHHYAKDSAGNTWTDGVAGGSIAFLTVTSTRVVLGSLLSPSDQVFDDLVLLRWEASTELIAAVAGGSASFRAPTVRAGGSLIENPPMYMVGEDVSSRYLPHVASGTFEDYGQVLRFTLREV